MKGGGRRFSVQDAAWVVATIVGVAVAVAVGPAAGLRALGLWMIAGAVLRFCAGPDNRVAASPALQRFVTCVMAGTGLAMLRWPAVALAIIGWPEP